jgi:hypothetical protein
MIVQFLGICLFDVSGPGATVYLPNGRAGTHTIPSHSPVLVVRPNTVDAGNWGTPIVGPIPPLGAGDFWRFDLDGVDLSFTPAPPPTSSNFALLPHILDIGSIFCPDLRQLKTTLDDASIVSARLTVAGGLQTRKQLNGLAYTELAVADNVVVSAKPFGAGPTKTLTVTGATTMQIANIDLAFTTGDDMPHLGLYCHLLSAIAAPFAVDPASRAAADIGASRFARISSGADAMFRFFHQPGTSKDEYTLSVGCSNSQWP